MSQSIYHFRKLTLLTVIISSVLVACSSHHRVENRVNSFEHLPEPPSLFVSANFGPDGKLWRVLTSKRAVYVDYSTDNGKSFSHLQQINRQTQIVKSSSENRPSIAIDSKNRIYVTYAAEGQKPASLYLSTSMDGGKQFSSPVFLSDKAEQANTFQASIAINKRDQAFIFWHDDRDRTDYQQLGNSIYYAQIVDGVTTANIKASDVLCECCRLAVDFDTDNEPVVLGRFIYDATARDHGLLKFNDHHWQSWRVTDDDWKIEACPEQGPALSISDNGEYHIAWMTQGNRRKGLFYAHSTDHGMNFSTPMRIGNFDKLASNPAVFSQAQSIMLTWQEFDGDRNQLFIQQSIDSGNTWLPPRLVASSNSTADKPFFLSNSHQQIFLAWTTKNEGSQFFLVQ